MQVNMLDAKNRLSSLVAAAEQGEEIILARGGIPVAKIVKFNKPRLKPPGAWKGSIAISPGWNSAATNALVEGLFYGEEASPKTAPAGTRQKSTARSGKARAKR